MPVSGKQDWMSSPRYEEALRRMDEEARLYGPLLEHERADMQQSLADPQQGLVHRRYGELPTGEVVHMNRPHGYRSAQDMARERMFEQSDEAISRVDALLQRLEQAR